MNISIKEIEKIASLSRIKLTTEEKGAFGRQLTDILDYMEKLDELNTDDVQPMAYATTLKNVFREDNIESSYPRQEILKLSPSNSNGFFKVPKVLE
ncbi:MAG: Asp-tRNA(Asn)/Glu-tRNA(Gln) amidotransferase subunit GatC [Candidatus Brocadiaceae bacterium]|nr:Asp-tRNA(Asn)/Glu-tRNA(Gln) amidotransferase subunit GatC [Candidatus Brocadiaceae bacterium]